MTRDDIRTLVVILLFLAAMYVERWRLRRHERWEVFTGEDKWPFSSQFGNRFMRLDRFIIWAWSVLSRLISGMYNVLLIVGWGALGIWLLAMLNNLIRYML